jgi:hypothetical protein
VIFEVEVVTKVVTFLGEVVTVGGWSDGAVERWSGGRVDGGVKPPSPCSKPSAPKVLDIFALFDKVRGNSVL